MIAAAKPQPAVQLRSYQVSGVEQLRQAYRGGARAALYVLPTGGGKTVVFCHIVQHAVAKGSRVWIVVHRQELLWQTSRALDALGVMHGIITAGHRGGFERVQVATVQTLVRRIATGKVGRADLIVLDEAHHATAGSWRKVIRGRPEARLLGVTATPCRLDGQGLGAHVGGVFDAMIQGPSIGDLIAGGYLAPPVVYAPPQVVDLEGVTMRAGDYAQGEIAARLDKPRITGDAVEHYRRICPGQSAIAFCASVKHAEHVAESFRAAGYAAYSIDGSMGDRERKGLVEGLATGRVQVLTSCEIVSEGVDLPVVQAAIILRPTASTGLYLQQVGRALRPAPGKERALILDHVGNCMRHGLPDDEREWSLEGRPKRAGKKQAEEPTVQIRQCPMCYAAHPPRPECPQCGHVYEGRQVEQQDGSLQEVTAEDKEAMRRARRAEERRARSLDELREIARQRGYKPGWADHVWQARMAKRRGA